MDFRLAGALGINVSGNAKLRLASDVYSIGLGGLSVSGKASIIGLDFTIVNLGGIHTGGGSNTSLRMAGNTRQA